MSPYPNPSAIQEMSFEDLTGIEIRATRLDLVVEGDPELDGVARLLAEPGNGAPEMRLHGSRLIVSQEGRYSGSSVPVLKLPAGELAGVGANISRGNLTIENISGPVGVNIDSGDLRVSGGDGELGANVSSGNIVIRQREGEIGCNVSKGNLALTGCRGEIGVKVGKGNISAQDCRGVLGIRVDNGDVAVVRPVEQDLHISGARGDIAIQGGSLTAAEIEVMRGDISSTARLLFTEPAAGNATDEFDEALSAAVDDLEDATDELEEAARELADEVRFNLGSVELIAGESGVRVSTGGTERFIAGPEGVEFRRADGTPIFQASERGVRVGTTTASSGKEHFRFKTGRGSITLDIAEDQPARVELIVNRGSVHSTIPLVEVGRPGPRSSTRRYVGVSDSSETDRILVRAFTQRGDINVRAARAPREPARSDDRMSTPDTLRVRQRRQILEALAQGRITAAEADILLAAMERESG